LTRQAARRHPPHAEASDRFDAGERLAEPANIPRRSAVKPSMGHFISPRRNGTGLKKTRSRPSLRPILAGSTRSAIFTVGRDSCFF
jgi:hypothetical protein